MSHASVPLVKFLGFTGPRVLLLHVQEDESFYLFYYYYYFFYSNKRKGDYKKKSLTLLNQIEEMKGELVKMLSITR
jgi:hypothetical protein